MVEQRKQLCLLSSDSLCLQLIAVAATLLCCRAGSFPKILLKADIFDRSEAARCNFFACQIAKLLAALVGVDQTRL